MTVVTGDRRKNMPICFLRHTISNEMLECRFRVSLTSKRNINKLSFLRSRYLFMHVGLFKQSKIYTTFKNFQNQRGTNSATMHVKNCGWSESIFQDLRTNGNPTSKKHNFLFSCSEDVKLSYQRQSFFNLERVKTTEIAANTNCFTK